MLSIQSYNGLRAIKGNVNGNHMKQQGKKWPRENQQFKDNDRVFVSKNSILGNQDSIPLGSRLDPLVQMR